MKRIDIDRFEKLSGQLDGFHKELILLAKKSTTDAVNEFKLNFINGVLRQCNELLGEKYRPFTEFTEFATDALPSNSDTTFILAQYIECMEKLRIDNIDDGYRGRWYWKVDGTTSNIRTHPPKRIGK